MKHNPAQRTMFDDFAEGLVMPAPRLPSTGRTETTRQTSRQAAQSQKGKAAEDRRRILNFIKSQGDHGATDLEIQQALHLEGSTERPRRVELFAAELIRTDGTRPTPSGRNAAVWVVQEVVQ